MKKSRIQIGMVYSAKVGGSFLPVRVDKSLGHGRYEGAVMPGGKTVKIGTDAVKGDGETVKQWTARRSLPKAEEAPAPEAKPVAKVATLAKKSAKASKDAKPAGNRPQRKPGATSRGTSGLDAAVAVLAEAGKPMNCKDMVKRMLETGLWKTDGKTPAATIYAAIIREIAAKGGKSRFRKTDRGHFELTAAGIAARTAAGKEVA